MRLSLTLERILYGLTIINKSWVDYFIDQTEGLEDLQEIMDIFSGEKFLSEYPLYDRN